MFSIPQKVSPTQKKRLPWYIPTTLNSFVKFPLNQWRILDFRKGAAHCKKFPFLVKPNILADNENFMPLLVSSVKLSAKPHL